MLRVNLAGASPAAGTNSAQTPQSPARPADNVAFGTPLDEVAVSSAATSILAERSVRVSELKTIVNAPGYDAPALPISRKLVLNALARSG